MINKLSVLLLVIMIISCDDIEKPINPEASTNISKNDVLAQIELFSDSLISMNQFLYAEKDKLENNERIALKSKIAVLRQQLINKNLNYVNKFPNDTMSPYCLKNVKGIYDQIQAYEKSVSFMDSILINYPDFIFYSEVLEEKAGTLDYFISPRDTAIIRDAYEKVLAYPKLSKSKIKIYNERLSNLDKVFIN
ncbi:hypothetical protein N9335_02705 [Crocinitomicaceae bacterium]|nr:hypothetical protein [Crocinitomicaceae bacterium]